MRFVRFILALNLCWAALACAADIPMSAAQARALGIETVALASPSGISGDMLPAQVVIPDRQIRVVSAPLAGMVESVAVAVNESVRRGQPLARLQSPGLAELQRDFLQAGLQSQLAGESLARDEKLFAEGIIAESRYLATRNAAMVAAASAGEKRQALRLVGVNDAALGRLQGTRAFASALEIVAPGEGVVLEQMVAPGQRVEAAAPLFRLARLSPLWLEIQVPLGQADELAPGAAVRVPAARAVGKVVSVGSAVAEGSQTVLVRAEVGEGASRLRPGQFVEVLAGNGGGAGQWSVPGAALVRAANQQVYVFVRTPGGYRPLAVKVLRQNTASATVTGELRGDEQVVSKGASALKAAWQEPGRGGE